MDGNLEAALGAAKRGGGHRGTHHDAGPPISRIVAEVALRCPGEEITLG